MFLASFPINTTDQKANEAIEGICPVLKQIIRGDLIPPAGTDAVVSEKGIRLGINEVISTLFRGQNLGTGEGIYRDVDIDLANHIVYINLKSISTQTPDTISLFEDDLGTINIEFDNGIHTISKFVQGGNEQLYGYFSGDYSQSIPIYANEQADPRDIALAKTSVLFREPFSTDGNLIWVGTYDNEEYGRLLLEEDLITNYSFLLTEDNERILIYK